jgi:hypothetical protein
VKARERVRTKRGNVQFSHRYSRINFAISPFPNAARYGSMISSAPLGKLGNKLLVAAAGLLNAAYFCFIWSVGAFAGVEVAATVETEVEVLLELMMGREGHLLGSQPWEEVGGADGGGEGGGPVRTTNPVGG